MADEAPLSRPKPEHIKHTSLKLPPRINSEGYYRQNDVDPEKKRNMPSIVEKEEDKKLNVNATPFTPSGKFLKNQNQNEQKNPTYNYPNQSINNNMNMNGYNPYYQVQNNMNMRQQAAAPINPNYFNHNYSGYQNMQSQMNFSQQQNYFVNNNNSNYYYYNNQYQPPNNNQYPRYKKPSNQTRVPGQPFIPKVYQNNGNFRNSYNTPQINNNTNTTGQKTALKLSIHESPYIPKSKRNEKDANNSTNNQKANTPSNNSNVNNVVNNSNTNNGEEKIELSLESPNYIPTNVELKKKEEQIQKENQELETQKEEETKNKMDNEKEKEKDKDKKIEKEKSENKIPPKLPSEPKKPPSNLKDLLNSDIKVEPKKSTKEKTKKSDITEINYQKTNKRWQNPNNKRIEAFNEKDKRIKEMEERRQKEEERQRKEEEKRQKEEERQRQKKEEEKRQKEEERKRKEEEEKKREEERKRIEEEEKKKKEEELKKQMELEENRKKEEERKRKEEEEEEKRKELEKNKVIEKKYFIVFKNKKSEKKEYKYTFEYIMQFQKWKISNEEELLTSVAKQHFEEFKEVEKDEGKPKKRDNRDISKSSYFKPRSTTSYSKVQLVKEEPNSLNPSSSEGGMEQWARKDMTKEIKAAEEFKHKLEETIKDDPTKRDLRDFLNMLTKDNYETIKKRIFDKIKEGIEDQIKFLDVLFQKAVSEQAYVEIYAKLCKDLDKDLPQKSTPKEAKDGGKPQKPTSEMRKKLLDKCRTVFQIEHNEKFDEYIKVKDPEERENKLKKFVLGNVYFITELIKNKILSKKIAPLCINHLFKRYENAQGDEKLKLINIQAIVIFTDQFGTLLHSQEKKIASEEAKKFKKNIDDIFEKLDKVKDEKDFPSFIKYRIINLIEKKKSGYQRSKFEEYRIAKSKKELEQELENQGQITQDNINDKIKRGLSDYREFVEEEGTSEKYPWKETTYLYDEKKKSLDDILEGYIVNCGDFIEKESNIKYAKDYIKELIEYYGNRILKKEKKELKNRLFKLLDIVKDTAIDVPKIYDIYAYVIFIFLENNIMEVNDLEEIIDEKDAIDEDYKIISENFKKAYDYYKKKNFKEVVASFNFVKNHSKLFEWLYKADEEEEKKNKAE